MFTIECRYGRYGSIAKTDATTHYEQLLAHAAEIAEAARKTEGVTGGTIRKVFKRKDDYGRMETHAYYLVPWATFNLANQWEGVSLKDRLYRYHGRYSYRFGFNAEATPEIVVEDIRFFFAQRFPQWFSATGPRLREPVRSVHFRPSLRQSAQILCLMDARQESLDEVEDEVLAYGLNALVERLGPDAEERVQGILRELEG